MLACPGCGKLVHTEELERLSAEAEAHTSAGDATAAATAWRRALELLPPTTRQHALVLEKIRALGPAVEAAPGRPARAAGSPWGAAVAGGALLLGGLGKIGTLLSMAATLGVYWTAFGWKWALGLVASIYVHEMGHVAWLRRYGIPATAPMFVPGFGAFVRLKQYPASPREDARVGLAGPTWGLGAAIVAKGLALLFHSGSLAAIAQVGAWINLFNLIPLGSLDGGRGLRSLAGLQRFGLALVCAGAWGWTHHWLPAVIGALALLRALGRDAPVEPDHPGLLRFVILVLALSALGAGPSLF